MSAPIVKMKILTATGTRPWRVQRRVMCAKKDFIKKLKTQR